MSKDNPAPPAADPVVDEEVEVTPEQALVESMVDVDGELVDNPEVSFVPEEPETPPETDEDEEDDGAAEAAPVDDKPVVTPPAASAKADEAEADPTGVYSPPTAPDPGEFTPGDYSFEVTTTEGKTVKITSPEEAQALAGQLDDDPGLLNASQYMQLNTKTALMMQNLEADKRAYEQTKNTFDEQQSQVKTRDETIAKWDREITYLTAKGELPELPAELNTAEAGAKWGTDYADRDGVKERLELFKFMESENEKRQAAGLDPMTSMLEAYSELKLQKLTSQEKETETKDKTVRRAKGSMVGGPAPYIPSTTKATEIVGTPGSLNDVMAEYWNQ